MKRITPSSLACCAAILVSAMAAPQFTTEVLAATPNPTSAFVKTRIYNDCPVTTINVTNNYPSLISFDETGLACSGANLHNWAFSTDGLVGASFDNNSDYRASADLVIDGSGNGEAGLRISPWYSQDVDGRLNVRTTDGEIACFGGRLPFFSFTGAFGINYVKGDPIHLEVTYKPNGLNASDPGTIEYRVVYLGNSYSSGALNFDMANPTEDPPHGLWGILNDARVGGYCQTFMDPGNFSSALQADFTNIRFVICPIEPDPSDAVVVARVYNDCPVTTLTVVNDYPSLVSFEDAGLACSGANLHIWQFADGPNATRLNNSHDFSFSADLVIDGTGNGEAGLRISPWYSQQVDGRFNVRTTDGEIACFGGRLPFYSFSGLPHEVRYTKGDPIHLEAIYHPNGLSMASPGTIEYKLTYLGDDYSSGELPFDLGNATEDPPRGLWGILNDARAGGYMQAFMDPGNFSSALEASFSDIEFHSGVAVELKIKPKKLNLNSKGKWVTAYIELPDPYSASQVDLSTVRLNGVAPISTTAKAPKIHNQTLKVKFDRPLVLTALSPGDAVLMTITGEVAGQCFAGSDFIKVKGPKVHAPAANQVVVPGSSTNVVWDVDEASPGLMALDLSLDGGATWSRLLEGVANTGSYAWNVPGNYVSNHAILRVVTEFESDEDGVVTDVEEAESDEFVISSIAGVGGSSLALALRGAVPNPSPRGLTVGFTLPHSGKATLAVYDVTGRQVVNREVGTLGAGPHTLKVADRVATGIYLVKLSQGTNQLTARAIVVN